jgi:transcriptional regulator with PAS, ATPase and Fis domain
MYSETMDSTSRIVYKSQKMQTVFRIADQVSCVDAAVLLQGESGTGKGVVSHYIHYKSNRRKMPFVTIDCGSIPDNLLESELFGYDKGAFTGADPGGKIGHLQMADNGTVFLDEVGELPLNLQVKLLHVLQNHKVLRVGGTKAEHVNIRVIAATNRDLSAMVKQGAFRSDLYYRLKVIPIYIAPLRERVEDIAPLIEETLKRYNEKYGTQKRITGRCLAKLCAYSWPGNVRELENTVEYIAVMSTGAQIDLDVLPHEIAEKTDLPAWPFSDLSLFARDGNGDHSLSLRDAVEHLEISMLTVAMEKSRNTYEMSKLLGIDRSTVTRKINKYGLPRSFGHPE